LRIGRIELLDGADMIVGFDGGGEGLQRGERDILRKYRLLVGIYRLPVGKSIGLGVELR
jgi:hypothetical protein